MSHSENTSRNVINIYQISETYLNLQSVPTLDLMTQWCACYYPSFKRGVICCGC